MQPGLSYPGISIVFLCHDQDGKFLFNLRSQNCRDEQGRWDCGGGAVEFGLPVLDTLKKEIKEEYSADVIEYHYLGYRDVHREVDGQQSHWVTLDFLVLIDHDQVKNNEPQKFDQIDWFDFDHLPSPLHSQFPDFRTRYRTQIDQIVARVKNQPAITTPSTPS